MRTNEILNFSMLGALIIIFGILISQYFEPKTVWHHSEVEAVNSLVQIYNAEWKWYNSDIDDNNTADFWTRDIAGLFFYTHPKTGNKIKFIPKEIATADLKPYPNFYMGNTIEKAPYKGYCFKMALYDENGFFQAKPDPATGIHYQNEKFFVIAFPKFNKNLRAFIIDTNKQVLYKKINTIEEADKWPNDPEKEGWKELDFKK